MLDYSINSDFSINKNISKYSLFKIELFLLGELSQSEQNEIVEAMKNDPKLANFIERARLWSEQAEKLKLRKIPSTKVSVFNEIISNGKLKFSKLIDGIENLPWAIRIPVFATVTLFVGLVATLNYQTQNKQSESRFQAKGIIGADMLLELKSKSYPNGSDIVVNSGDTVKVLYRSTDSVYFQFWNQVGEKTLTPLNKENSQQLPPSTKWVHTGKSLVLDDVASPVNVIVVWADNKQELFEMANKLEAGKILPEDKSAIFHIHPQSKQPPTQN